MLEYNEIKKRITALLYLDIDKEERFFLTSGEICVFVYETQTLSMGI
jgi:hypothetical protein